MTIRYLEIFAEVCRYMNMSKAAQALMISQSSVSQAVTALEKEYGVRLFERLNHALYLTPAGEELLYLSSQVLKSIERMNAAMTDVPMTLNIGCCNTVGVSLLFPFISRFKQKNAGIHVTAEITNTKTLEEKILNGMLDVAIIPETHCLPYFKYLPFLNDEIGVVCWAGHPLAGQSLCLKDLQNEIFVGREAGSGTDTLLKNFCVKKGLNLKFDCVCNSTASVKQAVLHKMGLAVMSVFLVKKELAEQRLALINVKDKELARRFVIIYHKDKIFGGALGLFADFCAGLGQRGLEELIEC